MPYEVLNGPVIAEGEALSDALDLNGGSIVRITTPTPLPDDAGFSLGLISFQIGLPGMARYVDLYRESKEVTMACGPARGMLAPVEWPESISHIKIRSGTAAHPLAQLERREFAVATFKP
jgi:hypothetical protein